MNRMTQDEKASKAALARRVKELGCSMTIERHGDQTRLGVEAPKGHRFEVELHEMVDWVHAPWHPDYADMLDRLTVGVEPCEDTECDWCHPEDEVQTDD